MDGQPRLLPRKTRDHGCLTDAATGQQTQLSIAAAKTIARYIAAKIEHSHGPPPRLPLADTAMRLSRNPSSSLRRPSLRTHPEASRSLVYGWSLLDLYVPGDEGQPARQPPRTHYNGTGL